MYVPWFQSSSTARTGRKAHSGVEPLIAQWYFSMVHRSKWTQYFRKHTNFLFKLMTSPYVQMEQKSQNPSFLITLLVFKSHFSNVRNDGMKCPYLSRPKEEHFKVVIPEMIMFQSCSSSKVLNTTWDYCLQISDKGWGQDPVGFWLPGALKHIVLPNSSPVKSYFPNTSE